MPADGKVRPILRALHGRHPGAQPDPLEDQESGQGGQRDAGSLGLEMHPDKTFIGRNETGFDFLGYHFGPDWLFGGKNFV